MKSIKFIFFLFLFILLNFGGLLYAQTNLDNTLNANPEDPRMFFYDPVAEQFITDFTYEVYNDHGTSSDTTDDTCNGGDLVSSGEIGYVCAVCDAFVVEDGRGTTQDLTVSVDFTDGANDNFFSNVGDRIIPISGMEIILGYKGDISFDAAGVTVESTTYSPSFVADQGPATLYFYDKSDNGRSVFRSIHNFMLKLEVPALTHSGTYTNTIVFTLS